MKRFIFLLLIVFIACGGSFLIAGDGPNYTVSIDTVYQQGGTDVVVADGGTGASTLTDHGVLVGSGTDPVTPLAVGTNGQVLVGSTGADPVFATITDGEAITTTSGAGTLQIDCEDATDSNKGVAELATDAEAVTGTDTARATTPANITARLAAPGAIGGTTPAAGSFTTIKQTTGAAAGAIPVSDADGNLTLTGSTGTGAPVRANGAATTYNEVIKTTTGNLSAAECSGTQINNYGQSAENTQTLPAAAEGLGGTVVIATAGAGAFHLKAGAGDKIYLDGVALDDADKATLAAPAVGDCFQFKSFQTGAGAYDWIVTSEIGALTDGGA